jgi:hypothetical protein
VLVGDGQVVPKLEKEELVTREGSKVRLIEQKVVLAVET